jgi:hypothetical protein
MTIRGDGRKAGAVRGGGFLIVLAGTAVLAVGCGTQVARTDAGNDVLTTAVTRTTAQTARIAITTTMQMQGMTVSFAATGLFDFAHSRGMISMPSPIGMTELLIPPKTYIKFSANSGPQLPNGKTWLAMDDAVSGGSADSMPGPVGGNPGDMLASLTAISGSEKKISATVIRGVPATEYQVNVDPAKAAGRLPGWERESFSQFAKTLGSGTIPVDVWVDAQNLVRRMQMSFSPSASTGGLAGMGGPGEMRLIESIDFYDFGVPVRVSVPLASQIARFPQPGGPFVAVGSGGIWGSGVFVPPGAATPPKAAGTLTLAQTAAAEQAVTAFWAAVGRNDPVAVARTVLPSQRSCVSSAFDGAPKITVSSFRIVSAEPAGTGRATVRFTVSAKASFGGQDFPVFSGSSGGAQWFVAAQSAGHWYVDLSANSAVSFAGACA